MASDSAWQVDGPTTFSVSEPLTELRTRLVSGAVHVVGAPPGSPTRVEVSEVSGEALWVERRGGRLRLGYPDLSWRSLLAGVIGRGVRERYAVVSVSVPEDVTLTVGTVDADAVVSDVSSAAEVRTVGGRLTLTGLTGAVSVHSSSGDVEAQGLQGRLHVSTVSGEVTVLDSSASQLRVKTVGGRVTTDLPGRIGSVDLTTVSGDVAARLRSSAHTAVSVRSVSGALSTSFEELTTESGPGRHRMSGRLGSGAGTLAVSTVSGAVAVLRGATAPDPEPTRPPLVKET